ncbi:MAG: hypothetical protein A2103_04215 [Gammaproteobacteria bacterium GWF2_41_13]|nr:MAG: hypothetical protein A2103_04215 [Gammaproteobacteria bacterium GWF2_41_13]
MKAIILAAGMGTRMGKYAKEIPKGMVSFNGKPLLQWQIERLRAVGISDISIVTGYEARAITFPGITYYHNSNYAVTNMVESLMCAQRALHDDVLISYADIIYDLKLAKLMVESHFDIGVAVDELWRDYWMMRYGGTETDLETLTVSDNDRIVELGRPVNSSEGIHHRYIGLIKFSALGINKAIELYNKKKVKNESWIQSGKSFAQGYMTDLLDELIGDGNVVRPIVTRNGWLEFDTVRDYEMAAEMLAIRGNRSIVS